ncbi:protein tiptop [Musca domestica]|uniref:Protein tiptop n=1 Tax=Musca domestica TaxID=7370 RepID=A0A1I8MCW0_MUSDO|nr:protein tiptop [Musca domestica]
MMLHEAVMLEIYRQALNASELASPRCQSRESNASASGNNEARCPSNESHYSANDTHTSGQTPTPTTPPVALPLPATLPPAAAAALLPPQSAAMAAYFNAAAAAAAQQNHLLLTNPLAAAATLVQQASQQQSPRSPHSQQASTPTPSDVNTSTATTGDAVDASALDFSTKRGRRNSDIYGNASDDGDASGGCDMDGDGGDAEKNDNDADNTNDNETDDVNSPLDLSVNNGRKRHNDETEEPVVMPHKKLARSNDYKSMPASSTWVPPINPYLAAVAAASMSPKTPLSLDWNAKTKISPNEATKALEKMTEMTRLGSAATEPDTPTRHSANSVNSHNSSAGTPTNGRHSAWQSHWLNKGADAVKDVFKCVWCKQSFATLASLTTHMKETQHCGVNVPPPAVASAANAAHPGGNQAAPSPHHARHSTTQSGTSHSPASSVGSKSDLNMLIKETMPLPRKLVRGQDVWLGKGAEQTRQILKCMWCGQSFRSLAEMTSHMQETQHYTNIISQEQIISWKSTDDKGSRDNSSCGSSNRGCPSTNSVNTNPGSVTAPSPHSPATSGNPTVAAVLTCKVCDQAFPTLKELSSHMVKNNHYTEHMMRTNATAAPPPESAPTMIRSRSRQGKEKRKKSLPVRKLLEMERAQQDFKSSGMDQALTPLREFKATTKLQCETCGESFGLDIFVEHIRQCITLATEREMAMERSMKTRISNDDVSKTSYMQPPSMAPDYTMSSHQMPSTATRSESRKTMEGSGSPLSHTPGGDIICPLPSDSDKSSSGTSVLNALEQLIEKSFDSRPRHASGYGEGSATPLGSSILKRLGIDDNVDYTKPLMDPQTMQFLRSYSSYAPSSRDRSASESSSISERCSSRLESFTPERSFELSRQPTPRLTPEKFTPNTKESSYPVKIKSEPVDATDSEETEGNVAVSETPKTISVKKEFSMPEESEDFTKAKDLTERRSSVTPGSRSPSISERSITPKSAASVGDKKLMVGLPECSSLSALSSMFNNLSNIHSTNASTAIAEMNNNNANRTTSPAVANVKKPNANPLAALQKLCDTNDKPIASTRSSSASLMGHLTSPNSSSNSANVTGGCGNGGAAASTPSGNNSSGMLAFSWACNDAVVTADSIIKCSFCDTPFNSKGAYRHHLSKVHFVKEESDVISLKSPNSSPKSHTASPKSSINSSKSPVSQRAVPTPPSAVMSTSSTTPTINPYDESPQAKFLKYTELAKQLSSKNA